MPHELEKVRWGVIPIYCYKGTLVEKIIGGYKVLGQTCVKPEEVDEIIMNACSILNESVVTVKTDTGNNVCINSEK